MCNTKKGVGLETLIQEGEALIHKDAVDDFLRAGAQLYAVQQQAETFTCQLLRSVKPDPDLKALLDKYRY
jgi:hypothetical protein